MPIPVLAQISVASNVIPAVVGAKRFRVLDKPMKFLTVLCMLACLQGFGEYVVALIRPPNYFLSDYYRVIEVSMLCGVFYYSANSTQDRRLLGLLGSVFAVVWGVDLVLFSDPNHFNALMGMIARSFLMAMAAIALWIQTKDERSAFLERSIFWVAAGVILYSTGTLAVLGLGNYLMQLGRPYFVAAWHINWTLLIVTNIFYTKAILCKPRV